ncbi:IclR family transcriptional regulator (plasmid) [Halobaculum sp. CBA1158]|uniref:IclR family transcriptional regulator n=1 Tax=Halobaculum sp. CBA1158 TaxID=2904243 RepID=UPI001F41F5C7|nr:IclR family transcriptional regulator [Halobaculum sp. CBA1158]UIP01490.1 IclR family transcriptional regulator [Halobaculum sp. CBA1158]
MGGDTTPLKTVVRAFEVIDVLERKRSAGPSAVATELGVSRATAHDYLTTLASTGYVINDGGTYRIGYRFLGLGSRLKYRSVLFNAARAPLRKLSEETDDLCQVGLEEDGEWVLLHNNGDTSTVDMGTYPGLRFHIHTQAAGKAMLANFPDDRIDEIVDTHGLPEITEHTITDMAKLRDELDQIERDGYAVDSDQQDVGVSIIAAPVIVKGDVVGTISIACPTGRLQNEEYRSSRIRAVVETADEVSLNYRYSI